jgi:hypothetical protein
MEKTTRSGRLVKPGKRVVEMMSQYHSEDEEEEYEEGEPAPPCFYETTIQKKYSGKICGMDFEYEVGQKNIHIDTRNGSLSTYGRNDIFLFIPGVYLEHHFVFVVKPLQKSIEFIVNKKMYKIMVSSTPYDLQLKGRNEMKEYSVIQNSLYGTFVIQEENKMSIQLYRNSRKSSPFFTFIV